MNPLITLSKHLLNVLLVDAIRKAKNEAVSQNDFQKALELRTYEEELCKSLPTIGDLLALKAEMEDTNTPPVSDTGQSSENNNL